MRLAALLLLTAACKQAPEIKGKVVDVWGNPIEGATVMLVGQSERPLTDEDGWYTLSRVEGTHQIKAGREGYIQEHVEFEVPPGETPAGPVFKLYPKPADYGFYVLSTGTYTKLDPVRVHSVGNELASHRGLKSVGDARAEGTRLQVIFHTELKLDEIVRLGLELHKLDFVKQAELPGPLSATEVEVNLYSAAGEIPIEIKPMRSRTDYMITTKEELEPGYYAFQTQELLVPGEGDKFDEIPEELRVVFPIEVR